MLQRIILWGKRILLWWKRVAALTEIPRAARRRSYLYFDTSVVFGGAMESVLIYADRDAMMCIHKYRPLLCDTTTVTAVPISIEEWKRLVAWLKARLAGDTQQLVHKYCTDGAKMELHCFDREESWSCSLHFYALHMIDLGDLETFYGEFIDEVKRITKEA
jgi:hypothetical protein